MHYFMPIDKSQQRHSQKLYCYKKLQELKYKVPTY